jgi:hypothetical protein
MSPDSSQSQQAPHGDRLSVAMASDLSDAAAEGLAVGQELTIRHVIDLRKGIVARVARTVGVVAIAGAGLSAITGSRLAHSIALSMSFEDRGGPAGDAGVSGCAAGMATTSTTTTDTFEHKAGRR